MAQVVLKSPEFGIYTLFLLLLLLPVFSGSVFNMIAFFYLFEHCPVIAKATGGYYNWLHQGRGLLAVSSYCESTHTTHTKTHIPVLWLFTSDQNSNTIWCTGPLLLFLIHISGLDVPSQGQPQDLWVFFCIVMPEGCCDSDCLDCTSSVWWTWGCFGSLWVPFFRRHLVSVSCSYKGPTVIHQIIVYSSLGTSLVC